MSFLVTLVVNNSTYFITTNVASELIFMQRDFFDSLYCKVCKQHIKGTQIFHKSKSHLKILGIIKVTSKFHAEGPQILGTTVQNLVKATWHP
jgi:hypothetical protein